MDQFNRYLERLAELDVEYEVDTSSADVERDLRYIAEVYEEEEVPEEITELLAEMRAPLQPPLYNLTIYYPISRRGEIPPTPMVYASPRPITPADLMDSINAFYRTPLNQEDIDAYIRLNPEYIDLNEPILRTAIMGGPKLRDVIQGSPTGLRPYQDGYLLQLSW